MNYRTPFARGSRPFAGLVVLFALFMTSALQAEDRALVTRLVGLAKVQKAGQGDFKPLKLKTIIQSNDRIQTGPQSSLVIIYQGKEIRLGPKTDVVLENLKKGPESVKVKLEKGFTWIDVQKKSDQGVTVVSPTAVASVRGTKFSVSHDHNGSATCVCEGTVATRHVDSEESEDLNQGFSNDFNEEGKVETNDFRELFDGLKVDNAFQPIIDKDPKMKDCTMCHRMTDLATDNSPDPTDY
ncbi:MAG: hypothetical protein CMN76_10120 [Spirochaetaceae bacterium]|nr:hypothetical protein [Spirochaetaceae bacterium]|tara:strand:- start:42951 stop:43670 length:720 start_codon:yes stop_codon:yes gene_type:complete